MEKEKQALAEYREELKRLFEQETGWDSTKLAWRGIWAHTPYQDAYKNAYRKWLEIRLARLNGVVKNLQLEKWTGWGEENEEDDYEDENDDLDLDIGVFRI